MCFPPGWNRPFMCLFLQTLTQGSDPFSLPTDKPLASSNSGHVYVHIRNVFIMPLRGKNQTASTTSVPELLNRFAVKAAYYCGEMEKLESLVTVV